MPTLTLAMNILCCKSCRGPFSIKVGSSTNLLKAADQASCMKGFGSAVEGDTQENQLINLLWQSAFEDRMGTHVNSRVVAHVFSLILVGPFVVLNGFRPRLCGSSILSVATTA